MCSCGIFELSFLEDWKVVVVGFGSGGFYVVIELVKVGVGKFVLVDFDWIELYNIICYICGLSDLGCLKINVMWDCILDKNLFVEVEIYNININNLDDVRRIFKGFDVVIVVIDNIRSRFNINIFFIEFGILIFYGKCVVRVVGGEVLRVRLKVGLCFFCIYIDVFMEVSVEEMFLFC